MIDGILVLFTCKRRGAARRRCLARGALNLTENDSINGRGFVAISDAILNLVHAHACASIDLCNTQSYYFSKLIKFDQ